MSVMSNSEVSNEMVYLNLIGTQLCNVLYEINSASRSRMCDTEDNIKTLFGMAGVLLGSVGQLGI